MPNDGSSVPSSSSLWSGCFSAAGFGFFGSFGAPDGVDPDLREGVYALLVGPHYETWAEACWLRRIGADLVGMSTVYEAIAAREWDVELLGLSTVTAVEGAEAGIDPDDVVRIAERSAARVGPLLARLVEEGLNS